jgi:hypothetical protein
MSDFTGDEQRSRPGLWFSHPAVTAAIVVALSTCFVAILNFGNNWISASYQRNTDLDKNKSAILLPILLENEPIMFREGTSR